MKVKKYTSCEFESCIDLFMSNVDKYFDMTELKEYRVFLCEEAENGHYFVLKENNVTVGAGGFIYLKGDFWLDWGVVHRSKHGLGLGGKLLEFRLDEVRKTNSFATVRMYTSQYTVGFYERFGFVIKSITENGYGENLHKYELENKRV